MAVLKKIRSKLWSQEDEVQIGTPRHFEPGPHLHAAPAAVYDVRPMTITHLDECWKLDQRCFVDGEAYSRETFEYLLTASESVSYRAVTRGGMMVGFIVGLVEQDFTGHVTTLGVSPEHRRRGIALKMMEKVEDGFRKRHVRMIRLEVRNINTGAQQLYRNLGFHATQKLPKYYSNGGDGLLMVKSLD